ncbi:hypothetical protein VKT23_011488 [Stygiomarasmius scandens]|uniref:Uncharacterized protein n=2 Tax=Marasmiellus scandens TaxID=2682957 RepID=A0ABR1J963_9AGAR
MSSIVILGPALSDLKFRPGLAWAMKWKPGGVNQDPWPLSVMCDTPEEAEYLLEFFQPWIIENYHLRPLRFVESMKTSEVCLRVAQHVNIPGRIFWVAKGAKRPGLYFAGAEAMHSTNTAPSLFQRAFAFNNFLNAVAATHICEDDIMNLHPLHDYYPAHNPAMARTIRDIAMQQVGIDAEAESTAPTPTPSAPPPTQDNLPAREIPTTPTAARAARAGTPISTPVSGSRDQVNFITVSLLFDFQSPPNSPSHMRRPGVNRQTTPARHGTPSRDLTPGSGLNLNRELNYWSRYYFTSHGYTEENIEFIEELLREMEGVEDFTTWMSYQFASSDSCIRFVWSLIQDL